MIQELPRLLRIDSSGLLTASSTRLPLCMQSTPVTILQATYLPTYLPYLLPVPALVLRWS